MALKKITEAEMNEQGVCAAPDQLKGTVQENKAVFDRMVRNLVAPAYNACAEAVDQVNAQQGQWAAGESGRVTAEAARENAEKNRASAESARAAAETARASAEESRAAAEAARVTAEKNRASAESARAAAETARAGAEESRTAAEAERVNAENARSVWDDYDHTKAYVPGNKVVYNGSSYLNIAPCDGVLPSNPACWRMIAKRGADGNGAGDMRKEIYDPDGKEQNVYQYAEDAAQSAAASKADGTHASQHAAGGSDPLTPADIGAVNKAGDTMTGELKIASTGSNTGKVRFVCAGDGTDWKAACMDAVMQNDLFTRFAVFSRGNERLSAILQNFDTDGVLKNDAELLHTGNKPTGSYTGNGSSASRTISVGGIGNALVIWSEKGVVLVTPAGGFYGYSNTSFSHFPSGTAKFSGGVLTIASTHTALNTNGQTYNYQVL